MLEFILKSGACMAIFLLFYKLLLEKENMHVFKRFYLLGSLVASLVIPSLVFTEYVEATPAPFIMESNPIVIQQNTHTEDSIPISPALETDFIDIAAVLWGIYFFGLFFFGLKFVRNLFQIYKRIRENPKHKLSRFTQVLLQEKITPHTFFTYIFLNKTKFESNKIPKEVLLHEETHAKQKHSYDVVFVELLQAIFWVNPLIYFAKKAIKLNHEFLADQAVLQNNIDQTTYKNTLLSYLSPDSEKNHQPLANAINYSSIKKRFTVMKTHTSKKAILFRSLLLLPILTVMLYGFSETNIVPVEEKKLIDPDIQYDLESPIISNIKEELEEINLNSINYTDLQEYLIAENINVHINKKGQLLIQDELIKIENALEFLSNYNSDLSKEEKSKIVSATIHIETGAPQKTIRHIQEVLVEYGSATIDIVNWNKSEDSETIWITIMNDHEIWLKDKKIELIELTKELYSISSSQEVENKLKIQIYSEETLHQNFLNNILNEIKKVKVESIQVFTEKYIMTENAYQNKVDSQAKFNLKANKAIIEYETTPVIIHINKHGQLLVDDTLMDIEDLKKFLLKINPHLNEEEKKQSIHATIFIASDSPEYIINKVYKILSNYGNTTVQPMEEDFFVTRKAKPKKNTSNNKEKQSTASKKQIAEYNALAKKYNAMLSKSKSAQIKVKDVERLEYIYGLMSKKQKAAAESFPNFPPMPESPTPPKAPKVKKGDKNNIPPPPPSTPNNEEIELVEKANVYEQDAKLLKQDVLKIKQEAKLIEQEILIQKEASKLKEQAVLLKEQETRLKEHQGKLIVNEEVLQNVIENQEIMAFENVQVYQHNANGSKFSSPNIIEYTQSLAKQDAQFFFDGKKVSTKQGLKIVQNNKNIRVETHPYTNKKPEVRIHTNQNNTSIPAPPIPPKPVKPIDHVIGMAKKDAIFYYEGKEISSDKAIDILRNNKKINIDSRTSNGKKPVVKLSMEPFTLE